MRQTIEPIRLAFSQCRLCGEKIGAPSLLLGRLPFCNRFEQAAASNILADLDVVECEACQLVQLRETPTIPMLSRPAYPGSAIASPKAISMRWSKRCARSVPMRARYSAPGRLSSHS